MAHPQQPPVTPQKQIIPAEPAIDLDSPMWDNIACTPETKADLITLKRKASEASLKEPEMRAAPFLEWRLAVIEQILKFRKASKIALEEDLDFSSRNELSKEDILRAIEAEIDQLTEEQLFIIERGVTLQEDITDRTIDITDALPKIDKLRRALIEELKVSLLANSRERPAIKNPRLDRKSFQSLVNDYLDVCMPGPDGLKDYKWCNVLGEKLAGPVVRCAHIVPYSWNNRNLGYMFGAMEAPLESPRNGLSLFFKIEQAFDDCWIVIVPSGSADSVPTEWRVVLLNTAIKDLMFREPVFDEAGNKLPYRWGDIDGRKITFRNNNRPARRFLYMRYALAWMHAIDKSWPGFKQKVPRSKIWASPEITNGYVDESLLLDMCDEREGLPRDLINAGMFKQTPTFSKRSEALALHRTSDLILRHLRGERDEDKYDEIDEDEE